MSRRCTCATNRPRDGPGAGSHSPGSASDSDLTGCDRHSRVRGIVSSEIGVVGHLSGVETPDLHSQLSVRDGLTSREIAGRLQISVRTVDNHLASVYTKLGLHGREELTAVLGPERPIAIRP